ncbi:hypothetical protein [Candidatus Methanoperedens sp. BLZ2]|nr:hypothetical protein [Candidatus Methanoperedens sp. BLZ2]
MRRLDTQKAEASDIAKSYSISAINYKWSPLWKSNESKDTMINST